MQFRIFIVSTYQVHKIGSEDFQHITIFVHFSLLVLSIISHFCLRKVKNSLCDKIIQDFVKTYVWLVFVIYAIYISKHYKNFGFLKECQYEEGEDVKCPHSLFDKNLDPKD